MVKLWEILFIYLMTVVFALALVLPAVLDEAQKATSCRAAASE